MIEPLTIFVSVVISVLIVKLFTPSREEEKDFNKMTRYAVVALAKDMNRRLEFYYGLQQVGVYIKDFDKMYADVEVLQKMKNNLEEKINNADRKIFNVAKNAQEADEIISKGVDALATHLKLEIIPYKKQATESQILFNVVKLKKHKK
jgi:hypothetical protein